MDNFYIITNKLKDTDFSITNEVLDYIRQNGKKGILSQKDQEGNIIQGTVPKEADCALVLGGDGTFIRAARELEGLNIPLLGINLGTLGYLTEVELHDFRKALDILFHTKPSVEERMMLRGQVEDIPAHSAMNDIVITRDGSLRIIYFNIYVNEELLSTYQADGVIISTPTGTTGYNLSAGGPIVEPTASMFVITPICAHTLNTSSIVLSADDIIEVELCSGRYGRTEHAVAVFDGTNPISMVTGNRIVIKRAEETAKMIKLCNESFMKRLCMKMKGK
ncbi:NAD(+)/NADH kinase [Clostridium sp. C105KSO13]|uniref:NAD(+)/NADH kinase n=1 Tax=Clostridium sp. C105KSO13 TaxID=1776045 RepID=UPI00074086A2|nr:NAD(+)/NADH kinase [Clostridium sp. C105KSO13]CUX43352.1 putative inorganic polyphosphate/ATP-NAD kinase [Clostridium sp. C105KSO13]